MSVNDPTNDLCDVFLRATVLIFKAVGTIFQLGGKWSMLQQQEERRVFQTTAFLSFYMFINI